MADIPTRFNGRLTPKLTGGFGAQRKSRPGALLDLITANTAICAYLFALTMLQHCGALTLRRFAFSRGSGLRVGQAISSRWKHFSSTSDGKSQ